MGVPPAFDGKYWSDRMEDGTAPVRPFDRLMVIVASLSFVLSAVIVAVLVIYGTPIQYAAIWFAISPAVCGALYMLRTKFWLLIALGIVAAIPFLIGLPPEAGYGAVLILFAVPGIAALSCSLQRRTFFGTVGRAQSVNLKDKPSLSERAVRFLFDLPQCVDLRLMSVKRPIRRKMPWKDVAVTSAIGAMMSSLFWFFIAAGGETFEDQGAIMLTMVMALAIPLVVVPPVIYRTMDVGMDTNAGKYRMHLGLRGTAVRTMLPFMVLSFAAIIMLNWEETLSALISAASVTLASTIATFAVSLLYYGVMEASVANDVMAKWKLFRPTTLLSGTGGSEDNVPGTPRRDS